MLDHTNRPRLLFSLKFLGHCYPPLINSVARCSIIVQVSVVFYIFFLRATATPCVWVSHFLVVVHCTKQWLRHVTASRNALPLFWRFSIGFVSYFTSSVLFCGFSKICHLWSIFWQCSFCHLPQSMPKTLCGGSWCMCFNACFGSFLTKYWITQTVRGRYFPWTSSATAIPPW